MDDLIGLVNLAGLAALVVGPVIALRRRGARWKWFALGVASWAAALLVKIVVNVAYAAARPEASAWEQGVWYGTVSAVCELGMAALLLRPPLPAADVLAFGAGIGSFEVVYKIGSAVASAQSPDAGAPTESASAFVLIRLVEFAACLVSHTATRVLVYETRVLRRAAPAAVAFATFVLVDGAAAYGSAAKWDWLSNSVYGAYIACVVVLALVEAVAARAFWRRLGAG